MISQSASMINPVKRFFILTRDMEKEIDKDYENGSIICHIPRFPLPMGSYKVNLALFLDGIQEDHISDALIINVKMEIFWDR